MRPSRLIPVLVVVAACSTDITSVPQNPDSSLQVSAQAGKAVGQDGGSVFEPGRLIQEALWSPGYVRDFNNVPTTDWTYRKCQLNSYEDLDGNDFVSTAPDGSYRHESVTEHEGFVLIDEGTHPTNPALAFANRHVAYIGRASWTASRWVDNASGEPISVNSLAQGVVAPIDLGDAATAQLMNWLNNPEADDPDGHGLGSYRWIPTASYEDWMAPIFVTDEANDRVMVGGGQGIGYDLLNDPLGVIPVHPDPNLVGTVGRAVLAINALLAAAGERGDLIGVECDWQQNGGWVKQNKITYSKTWPKRLNGLFR